MFSRTRQTESPGGWARRLRTGQSDFGAIDEPSSGSQSSFERILGLRNRYSRIRRSKRTALGKLRELLRTRKIDRAGRGVYHRLINQRCTGPEMLRFHFYWFSAWEMGPAE